MRKMSQYLVWCPDRGETADDAKAVGADVAEAAEAWAEKSDRDGAGYEIVGGVEVEVVVRRVDLEREDAFTVTGESVPRYHARPVVTS